MITNVNEYLETVLREQTLTGDSEEIRELRKHRSDIEALLRREFDDSSPTIRYGGSKAKGTMIKAAYDLDMTCYFASEDDGAGTNLQEIYTNVGTALRDEYYTELKTSVIRLRDPSGKVDFHIDVVPGRFVKGATGDVFIYQASAEKQRLKTNLDVHIEHIRDSGVVDAIRLMKLWRELGGIRVKTFVLELLVVDLLKNRKDASIQKQLAHVWAQFRDNPEALSVEDPANPTGNDLSEHVSEIRDSLSAAAKATLAKVEDENWEAIFGPAESKSGGDQIASLRRIAATVRAPKQPWSSGR